MVTLYYTKADKSDITHLGKSIQDMEVFDDISVTHEDQVDDGIVVCYLFMQRV